MSKSLIFPFSKFFKIMCLNYAMPVRLIREYSTVTT